MLFCKMQVLSRVHDLHKLKQLINTSKTDTHVYILDVLKKSASFVEESRLESENKVIINLDYLSHENIIHLNEYLLSKKSVECKPFIKIDEIGPRVTTTPTYVHASLLEDIDDFKLKFKTNYTPQQTLIKKKMKECVKKLSKHKRVYTEHTYGGTVDDDELEVDAEVEVDDDIVCSELIESCDDGPDGPIEPDIEIESIDDIDVDADVEIDVDVVNETIADEVASITSMEITEDDGNTSAKLDFGTLSITDRYLYYINILESNGIDFGVLKDNINIQCLTI